MFRTFKSQEKPSRPATLADTAGYSYQYDFNQHAVQYSLTSYFGEPLGNLERCNPSLNQTEDRAKNGFWRV